jgi:hypothetical protein
MAKKTWWKEQQKNQPVPAEPFSSFASVPASVPAPTPVSIPAAAPVLVPVSPSPSHSASLPEPARHERERYAIELEETIKQTTARINRRNQDGQPDQDTLAWAQRELAAIRG